MREALQRVAYYDASAPGTGSGLQMSGVPPRYAWVLSGRHATPFGSDPRPSAEFETFLGRFGGELLSLSTLDQVAGRQGDQPAHPIARTIHRVGLPRLALAGLVQSRAQGFDAIIASGEDIGVPLALASLTRSTRVPVHMMFHGHHLDSRKLRRLAPLLRRMSHVHFHCLSQALRERTQAVLGIPDERCHATGYGIDTKYFGDGAANGTTTHDAPVGGTSADGMEDYAVIASAGAANRDYATLVAAVRDLPVKVCIAADSTWFSPAARGWAENFPAYVEARSYGTYARLRELYARARFVVVPMHPARHACGYAVIAEAMAMGRAVIATRTDSPPDFLVAGRTGLFVEAHDVEGLRTRIRRLLEQPGEAAELGLRAQELMAKIHSVAHFCERMEQIVAKSILDYRRRN